VREQSRGEMRISRWGLSKCRSAKAKTRFWIGMERSRSWPRSIWPPRNLCQSRNSLACWASASRQNRSTALLRRVTVSLTK
jgi:hypothetical protein